MIWFTWRQFRTQTWITVGGLAVVAVLLVITARSIADAYDAANVAGCGNNCTNAIETFLRAMRLAQPFARPPDAEGYPTSLSLNFRIGDL